MWREPSKWRQECVEVMAALLDLESRDEREEEVRVRIPLVSLTCNVVDV